MKLRLKKLSELEFKKSPRNWRNIIFPNWVPNKVRREIIDFWGTRNWRTPKDWAKSRKENCNYRLGEVITLNNFKDEPVTGKFIFCWNNIGRIIIGKQIEYVFFGRK